MASARVRSWSSCARCSAKRSMSSMSDSRPVTPCSTTSRTPPASVATTGDQRETSLRGPTGRTTPTSSTARTRRPAQAAPGQRVALTEEQHALADAHLARDFAARCLVRPIAHEHEPRRASRACLCERAHQPRDALHRTEIADVHGGRSVRLTAHARTGLGVRREPCGVDEVVDRVDATRAAHAWTKARARLVGQPARDRGHRVTGRDHELCQRGIGRVVADQGDVGSMQRRDDARRGTSCVCLCCRAREERGHCVRQRIVCVQDVEAAGAVDVEDRGRDREIVRRRVEQRVRDRCARCICTSPGERASRGGTSCENKCASCSSFRPAKARARWPRRRTLHRSDDAGSRCATRWPRRQLRSWSSSSTESGGSSGNSSTAAEVETSEVETAGSVCVAGAGFAAGVSSTSARVSAGGAGLVSRLGLDVGLGAAWVR